MGKSRDRACPCPQDLAGHEMKKTELPKMKNPRLKDFDYSQPYVYFLTICSKNKEKIFCNPDLNSEILNCLKQEKIEKGIAIYSYCLMSNHIH